MSGCSTTQSFSNTPVESIEFTKNIANLEQNYSDIEKYDRTFASPSAAPRKHDLERLWGEPETKKKWGEFLFSLGLGIGLTSAGYLTYPLFAAVYILNPSPKEEYIWKKGNYEIVANGRSGALVKYEKRIHNWEWEEKVDSIQHPTSALERDRPSTALHRPAETPDS